MHGDINQYQNVNIYRREQRNSIMNTVVSIGKGNAIPLLRYFLKIPVTDIFLFKKQYGKFADEMLKTQCPTIVGTAITIIEFFFVSFPA